MSPVSDKPAGGLRERKKARTRASIQRHALRLFREQGYDATTVDQIAEAAEVAPSTVFRYFPTKEDLVLQDDYDPMIIEAFRSQPLDVGPIQALRAAIREVFEQISESEGQAQADRLALIRTVPGLRAAMFDYLAGTITLISTAMAERIGRKPEDFLLRNFTGAIMGVALSALLTLADEPSADYLELFDRGMAHLAAGLPL
jgi:AcrR family transcriptional regulator